MLILGSPFAFAQSTAFSILQSLSLTTNLKVCLDAGDATSYDGSSQTWVDTSGGGYSFYRGAASSSESTDPTFNGSAGGQSSSEYFSFDGADLFTLNQSNPTWVNAIHKNSGAVTVCAWVWLNTTTSDQGIIGTYTNNPLPAWDLFVTAPSTLVFQTWGDVNQQVEIETTATIGEDQWVFAAVSFNEATGSHFLRINGTNENKSGTAPSPSSNSAGTTLRVGCGGDPSNGGNELESGGRMAMMCVWDSALTGAEVTSFFEATRTRFGV